MAASPIILTFVVVSSFIFQFALFGEEYASDSFGAFGELSEGCDLSDNPLVAFFDGIKCAIDKVIDFFKILGGVIVFFFKLATFDIPGAPWYVRAILTATVTGGFLWSMATLFRGN